MGSEYGNLETYAGIGSVRDLAELLLKVICQATVKELRNLTPLEREQHLRKKDYEKTLKQYGDRILPKDHPHSIMANRVLQRLIPYASVEGADWEVFVVKADDEMLAFCTPGSVFTVHWHILAKICF